MKNDIKHVNHISQKELITIAHRSSTKYNGNVRKKVKIGTIDPTKDGWRKCLGELEAEIMELMWKISEGSVQDLLEQLKTKRDIAYTTVMTVMDRLARKGFLTRKKQGKKYIYSPALSEEELEKEILTSLYSSLLKDWGKPALAHFIESLSQVDEAALEEIEKLIERKRSEKRKQ